MSTSDLTADHQSSTQGLSDGQLAHESVNAILRDRVQSDSKLSLEEAVDRLASCYNDDKEWASLVNLTLPAFVNKLPYDHPGHVKLAQLWSAYAQSGKWLANDTKFQFYDTMSMNLYDEVPDISTDDPDHHFEKDHDPLEYVNSQTFRAILIPLVRRENHVQFGLARHVEYAMKKAFTWDNSAEPPRVRDEYVMGAAQWPKWAVSEMFDLVQKPDDPELERQLRELRPKENDKRSTYLPFLEKRKARKEEKQSREIQKKIENRWPFTWEQWQSWKDGFSAVAEQDMYSETCRKMAEEVVGLMALQEKEMLEEDMKKE